MTKPNLDDYEECTLEEWVDIDDNYCSFRIDGKNIYFKKKEKKEKFPKRIETDAGYLELDENGWIFIFGSSGSETNRITEFELEQVRDAIEEAIKVRDRK
ncbi:MAG: hypothetical protein ACFFG0_02840 [Candidatus Thorarchaeota archaeon]